MGVYLLKDLCLVKERERILLVDDEPDILELLRYNLEKEGYEVQIAESGEEAVTLAGQFVPDLVVLDIMMPGMDGVETCDKLREDPHFAQTLITFLSARHEDYSQIAGFNAGADDYITKPIKPKVFLSKVKALLRRKRSESEETAILELDGLRIDTEKVLVYKGEKKIQLPKKEFQLLELLASKPGKVFKRDEIYSRIWGNDLFVGDRTIDVHIRKLREKIGQEMIKTIKGIGYKLDAA